MADEAAANELRWTTLFDNMQAKAKAAMEKNKPKPKAAAGGGGGDFAPEMTEMAVEHHGKKGGNKRMSVERIYQKKSQLEHILLRPDSYVGSVEAVTQAMWVYDEVTDTMVQREITFVPGLYKIFDEIMVNAADNKQRDPSMNCLKIDIDPENNKIKIWNNGKGIPVIEHKTEKMYVPTMIFGHLLTSSNYDDSEKKVTGGRNGYGAKLCNIFSKKFIVETSCNEYKKGFKQTWTDNMTKTKEPTITDARESDFTCITFFPDLEKFKMQSLDADTVALFTRRAYDVAASCKGVRVMLNGKRVPVKNFRDYIDLFIKDKSDEAGAPLKIVYEQPNPRWEVAITLSDKGFQQASFVNSIATTKGGRHVDYITDQIVSKIIEIVKKKNKGGVNIKPFQIKNHMWVFVNCLIENPTFDSQTKENMTLQVKSFGSKCQMTENFIKMSSKCGIVESILSWMKFKAQAQLNKKCHASKHSKLKGIPKLDDANDAGTKNSKDCTLILTEGDSAKTLAVAGLGVIGRDRYGVFPLRGKVLNVREATHKQIMDNAEINNVIKIMGLQFKEKYDSMDAINRLRYGKIMIMTDQDQDGSHIKGLLINFVHHFWPNLLKFNVIEEFITPLVKVTKSKQEKSFYSLPEFEEWKKETDNWHTWKIKYYKGLGTSTSKEAKEYFSDMDRHRIPFKYVGTEDDASINLAFSRKKIEERKEWLTNWMEERKRRSDMGLPELYLYGKETKKVTYNEFINRELILFSNMDNVRSIPSIVDGLKPGQRKVLFTCFKRNISKEVKVVQLAGSVSEQSAYHHGEVSLMGTIINLAQNFVGSNNMNLLQPIGQFGTRIHGGKDAASPRYIFTALSSLTRLTFCSNDDALLKAQFDDNLKIEPEWYCPIIPTVLCNGADGIGTGWSTKIPNYDIREVVANVKRMIDGLEPRKMLPSFKNFKGIIEEIGEGRFLVSGEVAIIDDQTIEITELPIKIWTQNYKEDVLEPLLHGSDKTQPLITDYKEYHTDTTVKFLVKMTPEKLAQSEEAGLHKVFKLQNQITTSSMVLFDHKGCIKRYTTAVEILREFFDVRMDMYKRRKDYLEGMMSAESLRLDNIARFIIEKIEGTIVIENKPKKEIIQLLVRRGYDSDPVKAWKEAQSKSMEMEENEDDEESDISTGPDFNYILSMPLWNLTKEKKDELCKQRDAKAVELEKLRRKSPSDLWEEDLETFLHALDAVEEQERNDEEISRNVKPKSAKPGKQKARKMPIQETMPSPMGRRVVPRVDSAMKIKATKEAAKKSRMKEKKELKLEDDDMDIKMEDNASEEPKSLAERLGATKIKKASRAPAGEGTRVRKPKSSPSPGTPSKRKKGGKKKNPWSDSSDSEKSDMNSDKDDDEGESFIVIPRDRGPRRAAAVKVKFELSDEEQIRSDNEDDNVVMNGSSEPVAAQRPSPMISDDDDDDDYDADSFKPTESTIFGQSNKTSDRAKESPLITADFSDSDDDKASLQPSALKWGTSTNSGPMTIDSDDDEDKDDIFPPKPKEPVAMKPKAAAKPRAPKKDKNQPSVESLFDKVLSKSSSSKGGSKSKTLTISSSEDETDFFAVKKDKAEGEKKAKKPRKKKDPDSDDKPKKKRAAVPKRSKMTSDSDELEDFMPKKKSKTSRKKKDFSDDEEDFNLDEDAVYPSAARTTTGRARSSVKYTFDSDEELSDF
ncbi:DNA topoisomerase 2-alpha-like isoform X2 [Haliotis cracherodii]|uniref:DNA topoisomerase 2-alpha-like isoform X2 n=1 Tax=Haliotis cracherodii TaxID=6455 RepID=UPI0039EB1A13